MKIIDLHTFRGDCIYVGRPMPGRPGSPLGNPYKVRAGDPPSTCLARYRQWLVDQVSAGNAAVLAALASITDDSVLGCWCATLEGEAIFTAAEVCHSQVIAKAVRHYRSIGVLAEAATETAS